ncbi:hypothetical protein FKQ60_04455 [Vibrio sp. A11]|uniref:hypothetical protein n=1 Tax=Vibrio sp. A11 TaxID=2591464 RepID=UPI0014827ABE|nr:hypothetical protein [Vibrio sp. A11]EKO3677326.1 hypothetical protein [Vibrio metschnikovii]NNN60100.1 hypothetical protein [Vibrio sp. A11]
MQIYSSPLIVMLSSLLMISHQAVANTQPFVYPQESESESEQSADFVPSYAASLTFGYDSNIYNKNDYRSERKLWWNSTLSHTFAPHYSVSLSTGAYRPLQQERGDFFTDTALALHRQSQFTFGETGRIGWQAQFTLPTSEFSRKDKLTTALRLSTPIQWQAVNIDWQFTPRLRKNFHRYETMGERSLTEWIYGFHFLGSYQWRDFTLSSSVLGGNTISYAGTRRNSFDYAGDVNLSYRVNQHVAFNVGASNSGVYYDAAQGTLGNIDLFDADRVIYSASISLNY